MILREHRDNVISTRAPRTEGDTALFRSTLALGYFNPRPPHGGRRRPRRTTGKLKDFNPRPPHGGRL